MRSRGIRTWGVASALILAAVAGCPQGVVVPPVNPDDPVEQPLPSNVPISVFLSVNRPRLVRNDATLGNATMTAQASLPADLRWRYVMEVAGREELTGFPNVRGGLIRVQRREGGRGVDVGANDVDLGAQGAVLRDIVEILRDPGLRETRIRVIVEAFNVTDPPRSAEEVASLTETPAGRAELLLVLARPTSSLTVAATSLDGVTLEPSLGAKQHVLRLRADIIGGAQFREGVRSSSCAAEGDLCCRFPADPAAGQPPARYRVTWRQKGTGLEGDPVCLLAPPVNPGSVDSAEALVDDPITGVVSSTVRFARPAATGSVAFEVVVTDAAGNSATGTVNINFATAEPLTVADAAPASPLVAPGRCVNLQASGQGGSGTYTIQFRTPAENPNDPDPARRVVHGRLAAGRCTPTLNVQTLVAPGMPVSGPEASFWAMDSGGRPDRGSVLITATVSDGVSEPATTSFPIEMRADKPLSLSAFFDVPAIDLNRATTLTATVTGGTSFRKTDAPTTRTSEGYFVCFKIDPGSGTLVCDNSAGLNCFPISAKEACVTGAAESEAQYRVRYQAPGAPGSDTIRVVLRDFFDEVTTTTGINISPVGSPGGVPAPVPSSCPGGLVSSLTASAGDTFVCAARPAGNPNSPRLPGGQKTITASTVGGTGPFTYSFALVGTLLPGEGVGMEGAASVDVANVGCTIGATSSTAAVDYLAPNDSSIIANRTVSVTVRDASGLATTTFVPLTLRNITADGGVSPISLTPSTPSPVIGGNPAQGGGLPGSLFTFQWTDRVTTPACIPDSTGCAIPGQCTSMERRCGTAFLSDPTAANPTFDHVTAGSGTYELCLVVSEHIGCTNMDINTCPNPSCTSVEDCIRIVVDSACNDNNPCTQNITFNNQCFFPPVPDGFVVNPDGVECIQIFCAGGFPFAAFNEPPGTPCGNPNPTDPDCDLPDQCDGNGMCSPNRVTAGMLCGSPPVPPDDQCANQDTCNGNGTCVPNHINEGMMCDNMIFCDGTDTCTTGVCTPSNVNPCVGPTPVCDAVTDQCVQCNMNSDCASDNIACNGPETCNQMTKSCQSGPPPCSGGTPACLELGNDMHMCVECTGDAHCAGNANGTICDTATNRCGQCLMDAMNTGCGGGTPFCEVVTFSGVDRNVCVQCLNSTHCAGTPATPICDLVDANTCVQCTGAVGGDAACTAMNQVCNPRVSNGSGTPTGTGACVQCNNNGDCPNVNPCGNGVCTNNQCGFNVTGMRCLIDTDNNGMPDACFNNGDRNPGNDCEVCTPALDNRNWTVLADGSACDDLDMCANDTCSGGVCVGFCAATDPTHPDCNAGVCECNTNSCPQGETCDTVTGMCIAP